MALRDNDMEAVEDVYNIHKKLDETTNMLRANHIAVSMRANVFPALV